MIIAVVRFPLPQPLSSGAATEAFLASAPSYQAIPGLLRKHYLRAPDGESAGGVYLWESREAAEKLYTDEWRQRLASRYGTEPTVEFFESLVTVEPDRIVETEPVYDTPHAKFSEHLRRYLESDGEDGHIWRDATCLLLTTRGRRTGRLRRTPLIYGRDGDDYVVVASYRGRDHNPLWYENLVVEPDVRVQVLEEVFSAEASTVDEGEERERLWKMMCGIYPDYEDYQDNTSRRIPVVRLQRT